MYRISRIILSCLFLSLGLHLNAQVARARDYLNNATEFFAAEDYRRAADLYQRVIAVDGVYDHQQFKAYNELARCYVMLGEYSLAQSAYHSAMEYVADDADHDALMLGQADLFLMCGRYTETDSVLSLVESPEFFRHRDIRRADMLFRRFDTDEALAILSRLIDSSKSDAEAIVPRQNRGYLLSRSSAPDTLALALSDLKFALNTLSPTKDIYYISLSNMAIVEAKLSDFDSAIAHIDEAVKWFATKQKSTRKYPDYIIALRKKAEILMMASRRSEAVEAFKAFYREELKYVKRNFASMSEQNRLDFWKKEKPLISQIFALERDCPDFLYDVALLRREVALLGGVASSPADSARMAQNMMLRLSVSGRDVRRNLSRKDVAVDFVRYDKYDPVSRKNVTRYGAIVAPSSKSKKPATFVPLWREDSIMNFDLGRRLLIDAVCSPGKASDKNKIYRSDSLARYVWGNLMPYLDGVENVYFAPDGLLHMLAIEHLYPLCDSINHRRFHRLTSTARLADNSSSSATSSSTMLILGGLDYDYNASPDSLTDDTNHDAMDYLRRHVRARNGIFSYLPKTRSEAIAIDSLIADSDTAFFKTEEMLKDDLLAHRYCRLHLATHGYALKVALPAVPDILRDSISEDKSLLASGIALTGANVAYRNGSRDDGVMSAREFCDIDLSDVDLVVISACQSAQGTVSDEGPAGLVRGLKKAGVKTIIATLWEIDDEATSLFMSKFYEMLTRTRDKHVALTAAQRYLRCEYRRSMLSKSAMERLMRRQSSEQLSAQHYTPFAAPYYWAAFILIDDI